MFQGLLKTLSVSPTPIGRTLLLVDHPESTATPLVHDYISEHLKAGILVVFLSFNHRFDDLVGLYRRLGHDINMLEARQLFKFVELNHKSDLVLDRTFENGALVVIDAPVAVEDREAIVALQKIFNKMTALMLDVLVLMHSPSAKPEASMLYRWLMHRSSLVGETRPLSSGLSRQIHGEIEFRHGGKSYEWPIHPDTLLYRFSESSIFFFYKGTAI